MESANLYKKTEVGVIPEDWEVRKLGEVASIVNGGTPNTKNSSYWNGDIKWCTPTDITKCKSKYLKDSEKKITREGLKNSSATLLPKGTLLLCSRATIGEIRIAYEEISTNQGFKSLVCGKDVYNEYLYYYIRQIKDILIGKSSGSTFLEISKKDIAIINIGLPPLPGQKAIAKVLSDVDELITSIEKLIDKKQKIKQGTMQLLLTGNKRLPGFTGEWEVRKLGEVFDITAGGDLKKDLYSVTRDDMHRYPIYSNGLFLKGLYGFSSSFDYPGDAITVTARGTIGNAYYRNHRFSAIGRVLVLQPKYEVNGFFASEYINGRVNFNVESTGVPQLTAPKVSSYKITFPPIPEQRAIAQILSDMDSEIEALLQKLEKYKLIKEGMMEKLLTGKVRLNE